MAWKTKSYKFTFREVINWPSTKCSDINQDREFPPTAGTPLQDEIFHLKEVIYNLVTKINQLMNQRRQYSGKRINNNWHNKKNQFGEKKKQEL